MLIAAGRGPARVPTCENALRTRTKFYHLVAAYDEGWFNADRLRHELRFEEWQDDFDVKTRTLLKMKVRTARVDDFSPVIVRALSLFGPGELRTLRVVEVDVFCLVTSLLQKASVSGSGPAPQIAQAIDVLYAIDAGGHFSPSPDIGSLAALLERHASTITELRAELPARMLEVASSALARCSRLESLTGAHGHDPFIWLGLSQLHTLCGVDMGKVSFADIAAALPKLNTLKAFGYCDNPAQAAAFFTDLLPRLRVFHFDGRWANAEEEPASTAVAPLPLLEELMWAMFDQNIAPREFLGAQPAVLDAPYALISQCWLGSVDEAARFLARVCDLKIRQVVDVDPLDPTDVARVLRAAPRLKKFYSGHYVEGGASWLAPTAPTHPAFEGLVHPRLVEFGLARDDEADTSDAIPPDAEWAAHLRRRNFPRLREVGVGGEAYFVTPLDCVPVETGAAV
jgi:hypothetical protein